MELTRGSRISLPGVGKGFTLYRSLYLKHPLRVSVLGYDVISPQPKFYESLSFKSCGTIHLPNSPDPNFDSKAHLEEHFSDARFNPSPVVDC